MRNAAIFALFNPNNNFVIMRKVLPFVAALVMVNLFSIASIAQSITIKGNVVNATSKEQAPAVSVIIKGTEEGTYTDDRGNFVLNTARKLPFTLVFSSVGFETKEFSVTDPQTIVSVILNQSSELGQEVVVSATRTPSRILESPVTIERINSAAIQRAPAASFYDMVATLKGVDLVTSSLTFKTPGTRGFNGSGNLRLNQIVDGMDNQAPGLNFAVGAFVGLNELDVESVELLPGASSALYGPGGMNGALLINSKNPFRYNGLSFQVKTGIMHIDNKQRPTSMYSNWAVRWAQKVSDRFAFKLNAEIIQAKDWLAADYRNYNRIGSSGNIKAGTRSTDPNFDGINVYGDETTADIRANVLNPLAQQVPFLKPYIDALNGGAAINVSRTGYTEKEVMDPNTTNFKATGAFHYKITDKIEAVAAGYWGTGTTVYTGSDRYSLRDLNMGQYKLELNHKNWFVRGWTTQENAGASYNATITTRLFNEAWKPSGGSTGWFAQYGQAYLANRLAGLDDISSHNAARSTADVGRPIAYSTQFKTIFDQVRKIPIKNGGGLFVDKTNLYALEGQYNLSHLLNNKVDVLIGGNMRRFVLNSEGTLFADTAGVIKINEQGAYVQIAKSLFKSVLRLSASMRYDKNQNFDGRFTPRLSAVIKIAEDNNLRMSYQSAYRFPSTQQQFIDLLVGQGVRLIGGTDFMLDKYSINATPSYTLSSFQAYAASAAAGAPNPTLLQQITFPKFKAEFVNSFELGYKALLMKKKLLLDVYGYYGVYDDFGVRTVVAKTYSNFAPGVPDPRNNFIYSVATNLSGKVKTYGGGISLDYSMRHNFLVSGNFSTDNLSDIPAGFVAFFNAPKYRTVLSLANTGFGYQKRLGFNVSFRWQDGFFYEGDFSQGDLPAFRTLDALVSYRIPAKKLMLKLGANNLTNSYYSNAIGNPQMGGLYYFSLGYNVF